jgi:hypothetical protein
VGQVQSGGTVAVVGLLLGCAGLSSPPSAPVGLLTLRSENQQCIVELVVLPRETTPLAQVPGSCHDWELVLSQDGTRLLLPSAQYEIHLARHEARALPPLEGLNQRDTIEQVLDYDAQGAPTWRMRLGVGEMQWVEGEGEVYPEVDEQRYVLREGAWVRQEGPVASGGRRLHPTRTDMDSVPAVTDPAVRGELEQASGSKPESWRLREPLAWTASEEGEAGLVHSDPVLLHLGRQWTKVPGLGRSSVALEVREPWLRMAAFPGKGQVLDLTTGEVAWSGSGPAVFWPQDLPLPSP